MGDTITTNLDALQDQVLADRFRLGRLLGQGGYGAVFEAEQISVQRPCAVKVIHTNFDSEYEDVLGRFRAEAVATSRLHHPNTVVIYDFGEDPERDLLFLAMEHLQGDNLGDILDTHGQLDLPTTMHIVNQIGASLQDAHDTGIVHRDIKPQNIMLISRGGEENFVKVIDFGIARVLQESTKSTLDRLTMTGVMVGTPHYMAPEQIRDQQVDGRTDMYALAMCTYRMLTGRTPFQGGTAVDVACQQLTDRPLPASVYAPDLNLSSAFDDVLLRALEKNLHDRFESMDAFVDALNQAAGMETSWTTTGSLRAVSAAPQQSSEHTTSTQPMLSVADAPSHDSEIAFAPTQEAQSDEVLRSAVALRASEQGAPQPHQTPRRTSVEARVTAPTRPAPTPSSTLSAPERAPQQGSRSPVNETSDAAASSPGSIPAQSIERGVDVMAPELAPVAPRGNNRLVVFAFLGGAAFLAVAIIAAVVAKSNSAEDSVTSNTPERPPESISANPPPVNTPAVNTPDQSSNTSPAEPDMSRVEAEKLPTPPKPSPSSTTSQANKKKPKRQKKPAAKKEEARKKEDTPSKTPKPETFPVKVSFRPFANHFVYKGKTYKDGGKVELTIGRHQVTVIKTGQEYKCAVPVGKLEREKGRRVITLSTCTQL